MAEKMKALERENRELRQANEILRKRRLRPIGFSLAVGIARRIRLPLSPL